ncbi:MAG: efflux RND transporter periplasmic adaptor subunit [Gemmatimonadetes bacterium]|nr:efflux RND transporter periplasmic adaptor subunit [Gemmatimonadota bacterium]
MNRRTVIFLVVFFLVAAGFGVVSLRKESGKRIEVETETVQKRKITAVVSANGSIGPKRKVDVSANRLGTITRIAVKEGDSVEEGDFLLQIDPIQYEQAVAQSRAGIASMRAELDKAAVNLNQATRELERIRMLIDQDLASPQQLLKAETDEKVARAQQRSLLAKLREQEASLKRGEHDLSLATILAPMTGVVVRLNVEEGETAVVGTMNQPGTVLLTLADLSELEAEVDVDETDVIDVALGQRAVITIDSYPDTSFGGAVTEVGNSALRSSRQTESVDFQVVITLDDPIPGAKPGLSASADIIVAIRDSVLSVPIPALTIRRDPALEKDDEDAPVDDDPTVRRKRNEREGVFVVREGKAYFVPVATGIAGDRFFEVRSGLSAGDEVVIGDFEAIRTLENENAVKIKP